MQMHITNKKRDKELCNDHNLLANEIAKSIKLYNWDFVLPDLPIGSFLVGGYIRDLILGELSATLDIDIVVPNDPQIVGENIVKRFNGKLIILDKEREVVRVIFGKLIFDIASQTDNSLKEDLKNRDFTINSIAYSFHENKIIDPLNGINDINQSLITTFREQNLLNDPLRMLRCFRFVSELNFKIEDELIKFIYKNKEKLALVSVERIQYELKKIFNGMEALKTIQLINKFQLFNWIQSYENHSEINLNIINNKYFNIEEANTFFSICFLIEILDDQSIQSFKFSKSEIAKARAIRKWKMVLLRKSIHDFSEIERFQLHNELEEILPAFILYLPKKLHLQWLKRWRNKEDKLFHPANLIDGDTIKRYINISDGPLLGDLMKHLSIELAYGRLDNFDEAIFKAKQWFKQNAPKCD